MWFRVLLGEVHMLLKCGLQYTEVAVSVTVKTLYFLKQKEVIPALLLLSLYPSPNYQTSDPA